MKSLLLIPKEYSLLSTITAGLSASNVESIHIDYETFFKPSVNRFVKKYESLPNKIKRAWKEPYIKKVNAGYLQLFETHKPDIVIIYNNQLIEPETVKYFKTKSKIVFFLGDNPFYTPTSDSNLAILFYADYIMCPDTFWVGQLETIGIKNLHFGVFGFNESIFYPFKTGTAEYEKYKCDMVYVGTGQKTSWGYKRFLFLNNFLNLDMRAYISGDGYSKKWKKYFPDLGAKIISHQFFDPGFNNLVCNCSKVYPVDLVPSLFHGIHIRIMDCIGSGIFPLVEYSHDLDRVFKECPIPSIKNYSAAERMARHYIIKDSEREILVNSLRQFVIERYAPGKIISSILQRIV